MDLQAPTPSSSDGLLDVPESSPPVESLAPAAATPPPPPEATEEAAAEAGAEAPAAAEGKPKRGLWKRGAKEKVAAAAPAEDGTKPKAKKKRRRKKRYDAPSWVVSFLVHVVVLAILGAATFSTEVKKAVANINSALITGTKGEEEMLSVLATPTAERSQESVGAEATAASSAPSSGFSGIGSGPPSTTPKVTGVSKGVGSSTGLPGVKVVAQVSGLNMMPSAAKLSVDLGNSGGISGDVTFDAKDVGEALDQVAREILRHLGQHKLTVVWLFDESESMKDDQRAIKEKFDRISSELKINTDTTSKKKSAVLDHAIVGFGKDIHYELKAPTTNIDLIGQAIDRLRVDDTGSENTLHAVTDVINSYSRLISKDRRLLIVLVTDESGDDGAFVEEAYQTAKNYKVPIYIIGRQAVFGYEWARLQYIDPVTKDVYWPLIRRGPETPDVEMLQWDGLHDRWDEQPSGFGPYELARLTRDTGGIYFLLPSEENMRIRQREKLYSIKQLKEYIPEYDSRKTYFANREKSEFRRTLYDIIQYTRPKPESPDPITRAGFTFRRHFPISPTLLLPACLEEYKIATQRVADLLKIQKRLEDLKRLRDREPLKRWQAHYDLMLAEIVTYQVKAYEYRACVQELGKTVPKPKVMPTADLVVEWVIDHSHDRKAPKDETEKKYQEAAALLKKVIEMHPRTPWADLAQDEINRGFGAQRNEWHHNPKYDERAKLVPKY